MKKKLEVGDKIASLDRSSQADSIITVTRVTPTLALCRVTEKHELKFNRNVSADRPFREKGDNGWFKTYYSIATDAHYAQIRHKLASKRLTETKWSNFPIETLEAVLEIITTKKDEEK